MHRTNSHGQPIGEEVDGWSTPPIPSSEPLAGRLVSLEPLDADMHGADLFSAFEDAPDSLWTYMSYGPFDRFSDFKETLDALGHNPGWVPFTIVVSGRPLGFAAYLRVAPQDGTLEIGSITLSPGLQRTTAATETLYLLIRNCFELGYRRCEWKCDALNEPSRRAAERLGFRFEGVFLQATLYKGRNRDTAWYAITDREWPALESAFIRWLSPDNFDDDGTQRRTLSQMREGN
jgi:RimJ/RimL family protein N-acetyltransferase